MEKIVYGVPVQFPDEEAVAPSFGYTDGEMKLLGRRH